LILGGGPAGSAAAIALARGGVRPELVERSDGTHDCVCGAFMSADTLAVLDQLGVDPEQLGARPISGLRLVAGTTCANLSLPFRAAGLARRTLDAALLEVAERAGAKVRRATRARAVYPASLAVELLGDELVLADALFLATGKHDLRGAPRPRTRAAADFVGLRAELPHSGRRFGALSGLVELHLFDRGYAGLLLQEQGSCNICLSVSRDRLASAGSVALLVAGILEEAPLLGDRIGGDLPRHWEAVAGLPYGWRASDTPSGLFRIGDQAAVIASLVGDGLGMALTSGVSAARAFLATGPDAAPEWQRRYANRAGRPVATGELLRRAAAHPLSRAALMALARHAAPLGVAAANATRIARA
jgi:flavin-dependent dehydrogenase